MKHQRGNRESLVPLFPTSLSIRVNGSLRTFRKMEIKHITALPITIDYPFWKGGSCPSPHTVIMGSAREGSQVGDWERVDGHMFFHNGYGKCDCK